MPPSVYRLCSCLPQKDESFSQAKQLSGASRIRGNLGMEPDSAGAKRWEGGVEKTWEEIGERADGTINYEDLQQQQRKRQRR